MSAPTIDFFGILSESKRIVTAHSRHFLALSVFFLLPLSFFLIAFPTFLNSIRSDTNHPETLLRYAPTPDTTATRYKTLSLSLLYATAILLLSLSATATVTYSVFHGFFGRPVKLVSTVRSLAASLFHLFLTAVSAISVLAVVFILVAAIVYLAVRSLHFLELRQFSPIAVFSIAVIFLGFAAIYLQANWALAPVVVVAEFSWGLTPLRRSAFLVRGARGVAVCLGMFFSVGIGLMLWLSSFGMVGIGFGWRRDVLMIARTALVSAVMVTLLLYALAANTVMYMYCKALQGELAGEIAAEFAREYVSLPFDEKKMPHLVSVADQLRV